MEKNRNKIEEAPDAERKATPSQQDARMKAKEESSNRKTRDHQPDPGNTEGRDKNKLLNEDADITDETTI